jgi:8-oxo-dGTP pyrophosphatase MutT (NUDIX family)
MKLELILEERTTVSLAVVRHEHKYLLGLSKANDARKNTWCLPGGHIKRNESPEHAAVRETKEETGIRCRVISGPISPNGLHNINCYLCKSSTAGPLKPNGEFATLGWFSIREMRALKLYKNVREILAKLGEIS